MKTVLIPVLVSSLFAQSSGGYAGGPTEQELWNTLAKQWVEVEALRPEQLTRSTPPAEALRVIDAADAARDSYLRTKESLFRSQAARFQALADKLAQGSGLLTTPEAAPVVVDLEKRISVLANAIRALASRKDPESLAESGALKNEREELGQLLAATRRAARTVDDTRNESIAAEMARQHAVAAFSAAAVTNLSLADSTASERRLWREHHQTLRQPFCEAEGASCNEKR